MRHIDTSLPYQSLVITGIAEPVRDFRLFTLRPDNGESPGYQAGQYLTLVDPGSPDIRRSYSMVSSPQLNEPLTIGVKKVDNGYFSRQLFRRVPGDRLLAAGTGGFFTLPDPVIDRMRLWFFAAGAGITPVYSLIKTLLAAPQSNIEVILVYSNHSPAHALFLEELSLMSHSDHRFRAAFLFSTDHNLRRARLSAELMFELLQEYHARLPSDLFYVCGPESYMRMCRFSLREAGVPDNHIRREHFVVRKIVPAANKPPDMREHEVVIDLAGQMKALRVQYPLTILEAAKRSGLHLPYSCQAGICGNCVARCISGTVWMSNNEVLTGTDLSEGLVLTCTGYPVFGDVLLNIG